MLRPELTDCFGTEQTIRECYEFGSVFLSIQTGSYVQLNKMILLRRLDFIASERIQPLEESLLSLLCLWIVDHFCWG